MEKKIPLTKEPIEQGRICWGCTYIYFINSSPDWSDMTPGSNFELSCGKGYWEFDSDVDGLTQFREKLQTAERCLAYTPRAY